MAPDEKPNKNWATEYLLDPLTEPTPAEETGLGASFKPTSTGNSSVPATSIAPSSTLPEYKTGSSTASTNPFRRKSPPSTSTSSPKDKASPTVHTRALSNGSATDRFPEYNDGVSRSRGSSSHSSPSGNGKGTRSRRSSSLRERYPGDTSHHPLATIEKDVKTAHRSPHLRKKHHHGSDSIDKLDDAALGSYHHESPYDAASLARNNSYNSAPLAALSGTTREALRATPRENVKDAIDRHRPLDGVAVVPPGEPDRLGRVYNYQEGPNMMVEHGGDYKRWPGVDYLPEDIKGKGEPSYTIEKQLKQHDAKVKAHPAANDGALELVERPRRSHDYAAASGAEHPLENGDANGNRSRSGSGTAHRLGGELKKRFGSLRRKDRGEGVHVDAAAH